MEIKGKRFVFAAACLAGLTILVASYTLKDRIQEQWYLHRFNATRDASEKNAAIQKLGELRSVKAVPLLLHELAGELSYKGERMAAVRPLRISRFDFLENWNLNTDLSGNPDEKSLLLYQALIQIGAPGVPTLLQVYLNDEEPFLDRLLYDAVERFGVQKHPMLYLQQMQH